MQLFTNNRGWATPQRARARSHLSRLLTRLGLFAALACQFAASGRAEDPPKKLESHVKAAFIVKFASFIEWPAGACADTNAPFLIGILGTDPFGKDFDEALKTESIKGRRVEIRRASQVDKLADCQMVFVADSETGRLEAILRRLQRKPVLVISDTPGAAQRGSMINFFKENGKVRFEFNVAAAEYANLRLSAKLLQVGRIVMPGRPEGRLGS